MPQVSSRSTRPLNCERTPSCASAKIYMRCAVINNSLTNVTQNAIEHKTLNYGICTVQPQNKFTIGRKCILPSIAGTLVDELRVSGIFPCV